MHAGPLASILAGFLSCAVAVLACGAAMLRGLRLELNRAEALCLSYVLGFPVVSTLTFALAFFGIARKGVFLTVAVLSVAALVRLAPWIRQRPRANFRSLSWPVRILLAVALASYGPPYLRQALAPTTAPDALTYHLGFVNLWNNAHGFVPLEDIYAAMPEGMEMMFLFAFSVGRHAAAQLIHFSLLLLLPALMTLYALRFRLGGGAGATAGILVFAAPVVGADGTAAYNDVALAVFALSAVWLLELWRETRRPGALIGSCLLAGFCLAIKYTGAPFVLLAALVVVWEYRRTPRLLYSRAVLASFALLAGTCLPYLVRNAVRFQNPVAPFGNAVFPNKHFHITFEQDYRQAMSHPNFVTWRELPGELIHGGPKLFAHLGTVYLLSPAAIAGLVFPETRLVTVAALAIGAPFFADKGTRFLIPMLPLLTLSMAFVIGRIPFGGVLLWLIAAAQLILSWPGIDKGPGWRVDPINWKVALHLGNDEDYLARQVAGYSFARTIDRMIPDGEPVYSMTALPQAYMRHMRVGRESARGETVIYLLLLNGRSTIEDRATFAFRLPADPILALDLRPTAESRALWAVNEIEVFGPHGQINPSPEWKVTASPFPWGAWFAFDGNEASRWDPWQEYRPGTWIRADFERDIVAQKAIVFAAYRDQDARLSMRALRSDGKWIDCGPPVSEVQRPRDRRRAATAAIRQLGFRYLVFSARDPAATLYYDHPEAWGLRTLSQSGDFKLLTTD